MHRYLRFVISSILLLTGCGANHALASDGTTGTTPSATPVHRNNGAFLGHAYVTTASFISANFNTMATNMQFSYGTNRLFVICGNIGSTGTLTNGSAAAPQVTAFLNAVSAWEAANPGYKFQVFAYLSGSLLSGSSFVDVSSSSVRSNIATEAGRFTSATASGSYVSSANRTFDGVFMDFEPAGGTSTAATTQFNNLKLLMDGVRTSVGTSKLTAFAAPQYSTTTASTYFWTPTYYYYMAGHVDLIVAMEYDTKLQSGSDYQAWIQAQTVSILQAVSGEYWTDGSHTAPTNGVKVLFAMPAYPNNPPNHYAVAENTAYAAPGVTAGLANVDAAASSYLGGAIVYLTTDGTGSDGYASYSTDWANFAAHW
ncbi:hypothetical protein ACFQBQ_01010 [Granulicella cerasi]|uniref:GH18 domain-containing protein n=1 Tax=Granulicella cerasi TaxID=741063 RepID=A0ABW1Z487_9BACT|nr:hypothetical protein [Granulicella cerasi]